MADFIFKTVGEKIGREVGKKLLKEKKNLGGILASSMKNLGGKQESKKVMTVLENKFHQIDTTR